MNRNNARQESNRDESRGKKVRTIFRRGKTWCQSPSCAVSHAQPKSNHEITRTVEHVLLLNDGRSLHAAAKLYQVSHMSKSMSRETVVLFHGASGKGTEI